MSSSKPRFGLKQMDDKEVEIPQSDLISRPSTTVSATEKDTPVDRTDRNSSPSQNSSKSNLSSTYPSVLQAERDPEPVVRFTNTKHDDRSVVDLATTSFVPAEARVKTSMSLPVSLDNLLQSKVYELKARGFRKITREAVVEDALRLYFGLK